MQGPSSYQILSAQQVNISGSGLPGNGLFVYQGAIGASPIIAEITAANGIESIDPVFGGLTQLIGGHINLFAGITLEVQITNNGLVIFNSHGAVIYSLDVSRDASFLYADTGSATQGMLIVSQSNAGAITDSFGNNVLPNFATYTKFGTTFYATSMSGGTVEYFQSISAGGPWTSGPSLSVIGGTGTGNSVGLGKSSGYSGAVSSSQGADFTSFTVTALAAAQCTKAWPIPANDALTGTTYRLTFSGTGQQGTITQEDLTFEMFSSIAPVTINHVFAALGATFNWRVQIEIEMQATTFNATVIAQAANTINVGYASGVAYTPTAANQLEGAAFWSGSGGSNSITCLSSHYERLGP